MNKWAGCTFCTHSCDRCPELRFDYSPPPADRYPLAGEDMLTRISSLGGSPIRSRDRGSSGSWGARIPVGIRARNAEGLVEIVPPSVHRKMSRTQTMVMPMSASTLRAVVAASTECGICFADELEDALTFDCKAHIFCTECMRRHCQERISRGATPTCPAEGCKAEASVLILSTLLSTKEFELYVLSSLRETKRFQNCPTLGCGTAVYLEVPRPKGGAASTAESTFEPGLATAVRCPECRKSFCLVCSQSAHPRYTCEEARYRRQKKLGGGSVLQEPLAEGLDIKPCPRCGANICKAFDGDCDHMTCSQCSKEFCWSCFADREVIYHHGNHYHKAYCRFYAAYKGPLEFLPDKCRECKRTGQPCKPSRF